MWKKPGSGSKGIRVAMLTSRVAAIDVFRCRFRRKPLGHNRGAERAGGGRVPDGAEN